MPFKSVAQQHFLFAKKPEVAQEFASKTPSSAYKNLPMHAPSVPKMPSSPNMQGSGWGALVKKMKEGV